MLSQAVQRQLQLIQHIANKALQLDPLSLQRLQQLEGKSLRLQCKEPALDVVISVANASLYLGSWAESSERFESSTVSCHLIGDLSAYSKLLSAEDKAAALINADLRLIGDSALLIDLEKILSSLELDWEYHLARIVGDVPAHLLGQRARRGWQFFRSAQPVFTRHLQEFVLEEAQLCPDQLEVEAFIEQTQDLSEKTERLQARIKRLQNRLASD